MATEEEVLKTMKFMHENRPEKVFEHINRQDLGVFAVIKYIHESTEEINSADISKHMKISSARITVLLRKLENKGMIEKSDSAKDARVKIIKLTDKGWKVADEHRKFVCKMAEKIVDEFGFEELEDLMYNLSRLKGIIEVEKNYFDKFDKMEGFDD